MLYMGPSAVTHYLLQTVPVPIRPSLKVVCISPVKELHYRFHIIPCTTNGVPERLWPGRVPTLHSNHLVSDSPRVTKEVNQGADGLAPFLTEACKPVFTDGRLERGSPA